MCDAEWHRTRSDMTMKKRTGKTRSLAFRIATTAFVVLFVVSAIMLAKELRQSKEEMQTFAELAALRQPLEVASARPGMMPAPTVPSSLAPIRIVIAEDGAVASDEPERVSEQESTEGTGERMPLKEYLPLYELNPDFFGWITVPDTKVNYPVMYNRNQPLKYLGHDFYGKDSYAGVPFLDSDCDPNGRFYLVYGHKMNDGSMFAGLVAYDKEVFWKEHPSFYFDTLYERRTYTVVVAMRARVLDRGEDGFRYYTHTSLDSEEEFEEYMRQARKLARYDTGVETSFGDELLVLSTCYHFTSNGRFVIIAKRIS